MRSFDFSNLTPSQASLLSFMGWHTRCGRAGPPDKRTVAKLIERGLVVEHVLRNGPFTLREYEVPVDVHMAWCTYCDENYDENGKRKRRGRR